jgi:hypothetical protein
VVCNPGHLKELIIHFPFGQCCFDKPNSQDELECRLTSIVEEAILNGWNPNSRGKAKVW